MKARTVCCKVLVDTKDASIAKTKKGDALVCNAECKGFVEMATDEQLKKLFG
ncbi:MAG: hypothetical protein WC759_00885 [Candidatus Micrarchaeia archaeon]|jgi:hypothetical protein